LLSFSFTLHRRARRRVVGAQLSQWMTYSLMEPLQAAGFIIGDLGAMTGTVVGYDDAALSLPCAHPVVVRRCRPPRVP
jgi:hypothetical protein